MPKFIVTSGSYFEPFSYDELVRPLQQMTDAQNEVADSYGQLSLETEALRRYISDNEDDRQAKALYDNYIEKLSALQDNLWRNGYNAGTRRDLASARASYASDIGRLSAAIQARQARSKEYWDMKHKNPDMITGADPGMSGLDNYLRDDMYGSNWYSYSGNDFMKQVGTDAAARAQEMFNDPQIMRDPRLAGYLTRITQSGFTSDEVNKAAYAVRMAENGDSRYLEALDPASGILAGVLRSHLESTGAKGNVSNNEYNRLIDYGVAGLSQAIGKRSYEYMSDKQWDQAAEWDMWKRKQEYELAAKAAATKASAGNSGADSAKFDDTFTRTLDAPNADKAEKQTRPYDATDKFLLITKDGKEITSDAQASDLVYSGDLRRRAYGELGFDIGRDAKPKGVLTTSDKYISGSVTHNGKTVETRYNPYGRYNGEAGVVQYREAGGRWLTSPELTAKYKDYRAEYEETLNYYTENEGSIAKHAKINPDKQHDDYTKYNVDFSTPLTEFRGAALSQPGNSPQSVTDTYIAREAYDSDYLERFSGLISNGISFKSKGKDDKITYDAQKDRNRRAYRGTSDYIHEMTDYGTLTRKAIKDPNDVFTFKDGKITNIKEIRINPDSVLDAASNGSFGKGYVIVKTNSNKEYAVNVDMMDSDVVDNLFAAKRVEMLNVINNRYLSESQVETLLKGICSRLSAELKDNLGFNMNLQSQGPTNSKNES